MYRIETESIQLGTYMDYVPGTGEIFSIFLGNLDQGLIIPRDSRYPVPHESAISKKDKSPLGTPYPGPHRSAVRNLNITSPLAIRLV